MLKEHELSIIKLGTAKTKETKRQLNEKIDALRQQLKERDAELSEKFYCIRSQEDQIRVLHFEAQRSEDKQRSLQTELHKLESTLTLKVQETQELTSLSKTTVF